MGWRVSGKMEENWLGGLIKYRERERSERGVKGKEYFHMLIDELKNEGVGGFL